MNTGLQYCLSFIFSILACYHGIDTARSIKAFDVKDNHPLYVAVAEIVYDTNNKFATLTCKTFPDDLALALEKQYLQKENIDNPADAKRLSLKIESYLKMHLRLKINGSQSNLIFINYRKQDNAISAYFRINNVDDIKKIEISDSIFYELYNKQINVIYVTVNGNRKSRQITNPVSEVGFEF